MCVFFRICLAVLFLVQLNMVGWAQSMINTIAGNGIQDFSGEGVPAIAASLNRPNGIEINTTDNLYIADTYNNRVRKVTRDGIITTVAGNGIGGFFGDGGQAIHAQLLLPTDVAFDSVGNLYIADMGNNRIRKVTSDGVISTIVGFGTQGYSGDGGPAILAELNNPFSIKIDAAGILYISDMNNHCVRRVSPDGFITTLVGNGSPGFAGDGGPAAAAQLNNPFGIEIDVAGNLYIADTYNNRIRKVTPAGLITTIAGQGNPGFSGDEGPAALAELKGPFGVNVDAAGNIFISDSLNHRIRRVTPEGVIDTVAGSGVQGFDGDGGSPAEAELSGPVSVSTDWMGNLYINDTGNNRIRKVTGIAGSLTFFPQIAVGDGYTTVFTFGNSGSDDLSGVVDLKDQQGNPFTVNALLDNPGAGVQSLTGTSFQILIPPGGVAFLTASALNPEDHVQSGWAQVQSSGGSLYGIVLYKLEHEEGLQTAAGVLPSELLQNATIPVDEDFSEQRYTAYALANPTNQLLSIKAGLVDQNGILVDDTLVITLQPGEQIASYLNWDLNQPELVFKGSFVLRAQAGGSFVAVALNQFQHLLTAIPVIPGKASHIPD